MKKVTDWADDLTYTGAMDFKDGADKAVEYAYDLNGNMLSLKRHGVTDYITSLPTHIRNYGIIDDLTMAYDGNRLKSVSDAAEEPTYAGTMDFRDGADGAEEYTYDANGNMTSDRNKGISSITYNMLNLPQTVLFEDGHETCYTYAADGRKLRVEYRLNNFSIVEAEKAKASDGYDAIASPSALDENGIIETPAEPISRTLMTRDYCGNYIYKNGCLERVMTENGYMQDGELYFYIKDYQGNVRVVFNQTNRPVEVNSYYPYGGLMAATTTEGTQPYKYSSKELDRENGLDWYDSKARMYDPTIGRTPTQDPMAEKYYSMSPYLWCAANPITFTDPNGRDFGDTLATQNAAAIDFGRCYNGQSIIENAEYVTNIYEILVDNGQSAYSYTKPQKGTSDKSTTPQQPPNGETVTARAHTHGAYMPSYKNNVFSGETNTSEGNKHSSEGDIFIYNYYEMDGYVATPNGSMRWYNFLTGEVQTISTQMPSDRNDPLRLNKESPLISILIKFSNIKTNN